MSRPWKEDNTLDRMEERLRYWNLETEIECALEEMAKGNMEITDVRRAADYTYDYGKADISFPFSVEAGEDDIYFTADWWSKGGWDRPLGADAIYLNIHQKPYSGGRRMELDPNNDPNNRTLLKAYLNLVDKIDDYVKKNIRKKG